MSNVNYTFEDKVGYGILPDGTTFVFDSDMFSKIQNVNFYRNGKNTADRKTYIIDHHGRCLHDYLFEHKKGLEIDHIIVEWTDDDVWKFLRHYGCKSNPLYECGFRRVGCIGCPMAGKVMRKFEFERYPTFKLAYTHAFDRMLKARRERGMQLSNGRDTGEELFDWWING